MAIEICTRCGTHVDLDYNTEGHYFEQKSWQTRMYEYVCEYCLTDEEIQELDGEYQ